MPVLKILRQPLINMKQILCIDEKLLEVDTERKHARYTGALKFAEYHRCCFYFDKTLKIKPG